MKKAGSIALSFLLTLILACMQLISFGQDNPQQDGTTQKNTTVTTESTTTTSTWYTEPWVWIVGGAVFILILVALIRSNSSRSEVSRTTVVRE